LHVDEETQPLYIFDGKEVEAETFKNTNADEIESVSVLKDKQATIVYGEKGKNGVVLITSKKAATVKNLNGVEVIGYGTSKNNQFEKYQIEASSSIDNKKPLLIVDGVPYPGNINDIKPEIIESISVIKDASAVAKYGELAKDGVVLIETKSTTTTKPKPIYLIDGKQVDPRTAYSVMSTKQMVQKIDHLSAEEATIKYGQKGENGAVEIYKKENPSYVDRLFSGTSPDKKPLVILSDGTEINSVEQIDEKYIRSIHALTEKAGVEKYGDKGKNGVIEVILKQADELEQNEIPVVLNGETTNKTIDKIDRDLIKNIKKIPPAEATKKYGAFGKFGVLEVTSRKVYTEKVDVKSTAELKDEKITTQYELRKFIAKNVRMPEDIKWGFASILTLVKIDNKGNVEILDNKPPSDDWVKLDEVVVVGYLQADAAPSKNAKKEMKAGEKESKRVISMLPKLAIPELMGKEVGIVIKFELQ
jgi:TonB-dependent SusC/RagA subfamily outer membrane receptor